MTAQRDTMSGPAWATFPPMRPATDPVFRPRWMPAWAKVALALVALLAVGVGGILLLGAYNPVAGMLTLIGAPIVLFFMATSDNASELFASIGTWMDEHDDRWVRADDDRTS